MILMRQSFDNMTGLDFITYDMTDVQKACSLPAFPIFAGEVMEYLDAVSRILLAESVAKAYPDVITFAFWCRRASVQQFSRKYSVAIGENNRMGRGLVFHIAPSNVAVNFAYSVVASLLAGNRSIVRLPSRSFVQVDIICKAFKEAAQVVPSLAGAVICVRYGHEREINDFFSSLCNTRVIWGGNRTIAELRASQLSARANEITFADRFSIAVIQADDYLLEEDKARVARDFWNDTYLTDQNACSSPKIIIWLGNSGIKEAQKQFWGILHNIVAEKYDLQPVQAVDKLTRVYRLGVACDSRLEMSADNMITRIRVEQLDGKLEAYCGNSGFFIEYVAEELVEILPLCNERCQTVAYYGERLCEELHKMIYSLRPRGVDRIVPIGRTMDFALTWDGKDLIYEMSRCVT